MTSEHALVDVVVFDEQPSVSVSEPEVELERPILLTVRDQLRRIELQRTFFGDTEHLRRQEKHLRGEAA